MQRSPKIEPELNAGKVLGKIFDRHRVSQGGKLKLDKDENKEHNDLIKVCLELLGASRVPVELYDRLYRRIVDARGERLADDPKAFVPYYPTAQEFITQFKILQRKLDQQKADNPTPKPCAMKHDDEADRLVFYYIGDQDVLLPCHSCRKDAHEARKTGRIEDKQLNRLRLPAPGETVGAPVSNLPTKSNTREVPKNLKDPIVVLRLDAARACDAMREAIGNPEEYENKRRHWAAINSEIHRLMTEQNEVKV